MPQRLAATALGDLLRAGMTVYAPGVSGESRLLVDALAAAPERAAGVAFTGVWLPGMNRFDYAGLHPDAQAEAFFVRREQAASDAAGRIRLRPLTYFQTYGYLRDHARIDLALLHVSPPGPDGRVSLGVANDFTPAILGKAGARLAHVNPAMPRTRGATIAFDDLDYVVEEECPLLTDRGGEDAVWAAIARHVATLVPDGATLEVGIGQVQQVLLGLTAHRGLRIHSGAVMTPLLALDRADALAAGECAVTVGMALGTPDLYAFVADTPRVQFAPVGHTHDIGILRAIERFFAINAVIEVDLLGQANAECIDGKAVSSAGGITDFMRGARLSPGGRAIVALPATAKGGSVSRIVPMLAPGVPVSVARTDMDVVVTEYGIADLRFADRDGRAAALIAVAAPPFRDELAAAWAEARRR